MPKRRRPMATREFQERVNVLAEFRYRLRRFLSFSEEVAEASGTSVQQYQLLQVVAAAPEGMRSISYIAERMVLRHNSAVELVGRAERSGLVRRKEDAADHRRALITLTDDGEAILRSLVGRHWAELAEQGPELMRALETLLGYGAEMGKRRIEAHGRHS